MSTEEAKEVVRQRGYINNESNPDTYPRIVMSTVRFETWEDGTRWLCYEVDKGGGVWEPAAIRELG